MPGEKREVWPEDKKYNFGVVFLSHVWCFTREWHFTSNKKIKWIFGLHIIYIALFSARSESCTCLFYAQRVYSWLEIVAFIIMYSRCQKWVSWWPIRSRLRTYVPFGRMFLYSGEMPLASKNQIISGIVAHRQPNRDLYWHDTYYIHILPSSRSRKHQQHEQCLWSRNF